MKKKIEDILLKHAMPRDKNFNNRLGCTYIICEERLMEDLIEDIIKVITI